MKISIPAIAAALAAATPVHAQEAAPPEAADSRDIIVTGTKLSGEFGAKSGIPLTRLPQSIQIVTAEDIVERGARSVGDLLRTVPSANPGFSRVGPYQSFSLKVRGFLADQMRNGIRQRYYEDVDASALSNIERVEVLKGPSGVLYGQSAVGGIVSIVTRQPEERTFGSLAVTGGSFGQKMLGFDMNSGLAPGLAVRLTGEVERSGTFVDYQDLDRKNLALNLRYAPSESVTAHLVAEYVARETLRNPGLPLAGTVNGGLPALPRGRYLGEPAFDTLTADAPLVQGWVEVKLGSGWTLTPRLQYQEFNSAFLQIRLRAPDAANPALVNRTGRRGREDDSYTIAQLDLAGRVTTGPLTHTLLVGYEYDRERSRFTQSNLTNVSPIDILSPVYGYSGTAPAETFAFDGFYNIDGHALYAQDQIDLTPRWNLIGAVRHSWIDASDGDYGGATNNRAKTSTTIWQLGSTYRLTDTVSLYAGYNTGFDVENTAGARTRTGTPLQPERSNQAEAGLRLRTGTLRASLALFQIKRTNAVTADPVDPDFSVNAGEQRVRGIEIEGEWQPLPGWELGGGYALMDGKVTRSNDGIVGKRIGDLPRHSLTARTSVAIPGTPLTLRGGMNHVTGRALVDGSDTTLPAYTLADIGAGLALAPFRIDATVSNLFDERYFTASGNGFAVYPGDPRTVSVRLSVGF